MATNKVSGQLHRVPSYHTLKRIANLWRELVPNSSRNKTTRGWIIFKSLTVLMSASDLQLVCIHTAHVPIWPSTFLGGGTRMLCGNIHDGSRKEGNQTSHGRSHFLHVFLGFLTSHFENVYHTHLFTVQQKK